MVSFDALSPEVRIEILFYLPDRNDITCLTKACPEMLATYTANKDLIRLRFYKKEFDDEMLQDALAIINFPMPEAGDEFMNAIMTKHAEMWLTKKLALPEQENSITTTLDLLDNLYDDLKDCTKLRLANKKHGGLHSFPGFDPAFDTRNKTNPTIIKIAPAIRMIEELSSEERAKFFKVLLKSEAFDRFRDFTNNVKGCIKLSKTFKRIYAANHPEEDEDQSA
ncbi:hypothetical protein FAUST_4820 [Fusarium austroamericanum]|uniref:F-box domain-containing protein n=1 Tax=Fusarium austroamericanum TaxID=282268 RepID=A0AAN6HGE6_FUSAU|nr:hypothetical protein FAUST_4820 [Fusarium austroamericanum]